MNLTTHDLVRLLFASIFLLGLMIWRLGGDGGDGDAIPHAVMGVGVVGFVCAQLVPGILGRKRREPRGFDVVRKERDRGEKNGD